MLKIKMENGGNMNNETKGNLLNSKLDQIYRNEFTKFIELQNRIIDLTKFIKHKNAGHCKCDEPAFKLEINIDKEKRIEYSVEIYSYLLNLNDGNRHHYFTSTSLEDLYTQINDALSREEQYHYQKR